jgi:ATP-dependent Lhr-like helicase
VVALHHGSLDREVREWVETGLKRGELKAVVCTASLDLGVDFLPVERVLQVGSAKGIARLLQRAGRSGHAPGRISRVTLVPTNSLELLEAAGAKRAVATRRIEARQVPNKPFDVLVQHLVTVALGGGFRSEELYEEVKSAWSYRHLTPEEWQWALDFVARGGQSLSVYPEYRRVLPDEEGVYRVPDAKIGRRHRMSIGTIVSDAQMQVKYMSGGRIGSVEESFIGRLKPGDHFLFSGRILELVRVHEMTAYVKRSTSTRARSAAGAAPRCRSVVRAGARGAGRTEAGRRRHLRRPGNAGAAAAAGNPGPLVGPAHSDVLVVESMKSREGYPSVRVSLCGRSVHTGWPRCWRSASGRMSCRRPFRWPSTITASNCCRRNRWTGPPCSRGDWRRRRPVRHGPPAGGRAGQPERDPAVAAALPRSGAHRRAGVPGLSGPA